VVIVEGLRTFQSRLITLSYRLPAKRRSLGLVLQSDALRQSDLPGVTIHGDMDPDSFALSWSEIPWTQRMTILLVAPLYGVVMYLFASREYFTRRHTVDSLPDRLDYRLSQVRELIVDERDQRLIERIESCLAERRDDQRKVAILFGGGHMPAVVEVLTSRHGYHVVHSEWVTAIAT
jgi:hypothetical protein